jgi:cytochrome c oxidase cbb3-type subunit 3
MSQEPKRGHFAKSKGEVILREHEFDGIQEYDQKLPNWWLFTFYGAVAWFVIYWVLYYGTSLFQTDQERVTAKILAIQQARLEELEKTLATLNDSVLVHQWAADPAIVAAGEAVYLTNCSACHAADLTAVVDIGGDKFPLPGLSLADGEWKFGGRPMDVFNIIHDGSPPESDGNNGAMMQPWGAVLGPKQVAEVTAYIISKVPADFAEVPPP